MPVVKGAPQTPPIVYPNNNNNNNNNNNKEVLNREFVAMAERDPTEAVSRADATVLGYCTVILMAWYHGTRLLLGSCPPAPPVPQTPPGAVHLLRGASKYTAPGGVWGTGGGQESRCPHGVAPRYSTTG